MSEVKNKSTRLLENAVHSISMGLEDFESSESNQRRIISSVRNLFAGILLLFKHKLNLLCTDESLIKQKITPIFNENGIVE